MESTQELRHWGIKGQKWGIRRYQNPDGTLTEAGKKRYYYQNPDGSLTEAGKKDYMKAAKKGKLDVSKLSDADLNMINSRFAREKTFKQNVSDYEKSTFKYRLKEAALARIKGFGGGGGKGKGGGSGIAKMLAMPIKKAFEEAFKDSSSGGGKDDGYDEDSKWWGDVSNKGHRFTEKYFDPEKRPGIERTKKDVERGKKHMNFVINETSGGRMGTFDATSGGNSYMEGRVRAAQQKKAEEKARRAAQRDAENRRQKNEAKNRRKEMDTEERLKKLGFAYASHSAFVVCRSSSDELYHWGIKGQKWGVRRFENPDGTLTPEGKERYRSDEEKRKLADTVEKTVARRRSTFATDGELKKASKYVSEVEEHPVVKDAARKVKTELQAYRKADQELIKQEDAFYNDRKTYEKYLNKAVNNFMKEVGPDWGTRQEVYDWFKYDDGDQGERSSIELYKRSPEGKKLAQAEKRAGETYKAYSDACKKYASEYLGSYGDKNISAYGDWQRNIASRLSDFVMRVAENDK